MPELAPENLGEVFALAAAVTWASALILFKQSGEQMSPLALNLYKNTVALVLLGVTLLVLPNGMERVLAHPPVDHWSLVFGGIVGIALADTLFFHALNRIGVGIITIVECMYAPSLLLFGWILLHEWLGPFQYVGIALIISGVLISTRHTPPPGRGPRDIVIGALVGSAAMMLMGFGIILNRPVLQIADYPLLWAVTIRLGAGTVALAATGLASPRRRAHFAVFIPRRIWRQSLPAAFLGTYLCLIFWIAGFKYAEETAVAAILNQTSIFFAMIFAAIFIREPFTRRKAVAVMLAFTGVLLVTLNERLMNLIA